MKWVVGLLFSAVVAWILATGSVRSQQVGPPIVFQKPPNEAWKTVLFTRVSQYGHRNWIVIADSAYPSQSRGGIETVVTSTDHIDVVSEVLAQLGRQKHVRPVVYMDSELPYVPEKDAPGIGKVRDDLAKVLGDRKPTPIAHEQVIHNLDKAGEKFSVLVLKTTMTLPYTSVFLELDCGYWSPDAEKRLRDAIKAAKP
jgi:L-fucose mutarotase/ribose pyranase (RbsD/FucU family)